MIFSDIVMPPKSLLIYEALLPRKTFSPQDKQRYDQLYKGFIGEKRFEKFFQEGNYPNVLPLFGCLFEVGGREFQVDCILLTSDTIFLLEVKNYTGDYYIKNGNVFRLQTDNEIFNPIDQLKRTEFSFQRMLNDLKTNYNVRSYVLFVNDNFMLYGANVQSPMIFPSQINRFLQKTNANVNSITERTERIADILINKRKQQSTYERIPDYDFMQLNQGIFCHNCFTQLKRETKFKFICGNCNTSYQSNEIILYATAQFHLLFPDKNITTKSIVEWCGGVFSINSIRDVLAKNLNINLNGRYTHYSFTNKETHLEVIINSFNALR